MSVESARPVEVVRLDGKSVIVLTHERWLTFEQKTATLAQLREAFGDEHHLLILDGGFELKVVQP